MALTGTYNRTLDEKQRVAIPKPLREAFAADNGESVSFVYIAPGNDTSLAIYTEKSFQALATRLAEKSTGRADIRTYLRLFYARAERVDIDSQGRIRIPERLVDLGKLEHQVVMLGVHDHAEIWDQNLWQSYLNRFTDEFDQMTGSVFE